MNRISLKLTNGFGNNLFQIFYGELLKKYLNISVCYVYDKDNHKIIEELVKIGLDFHYENSKKVYFKKLTEKNYDYVHPKKSNLTDFIKNRTLVSGYFENQDFFLEDRDYLKGLLSPCEKKSKNNLAIHLRLGDRLFHDRLDYLIQDFEIEKVILSNNFDEIFYVSDTNLECISKIEHLVNLQTHISSKRRLSRQKSKDILDYLEKIQKIIEKYNIKNCSRKVSADFQFLRSENNILFADATMSWWASILSNKKNIYTRKSWRPYKQQKKNLIPKLKNWIFIDE